MAFCAADSQQKAPLIKDPFYSSFLQSPPFPATRGAGLEEPDHVKDSHSDTGMLCLCLNLGRQFIFPRNAGTSNSGGDPSYERGYFAFALLKLHSGAPDTHKNLNKHIEEIVILNNLLHIN